MKGVVSPSEHQCNNQINAELVLGIPKIPKLGGC